MLVSEVGIWKVHEGKFITNNGVEAVTIIEDDSKQFYIRNPEELMVALAKYLGVESFEAV